jgi:hypothetical protein
MQFSPEEIQQLWAAKEKSQREAACVGFTFIKSDALKAAEYLEFLLNPIEDPHKRREAAAFIIQMDTNEFAATKLGVTAMLNNHPLQQKLSVLAAGKAR